MTIESTMKTLQKWEERARESLAEHEKPNPLRYQVGGSHYQEMNIQPAEFCLANMSIEEIRGAMRWNIQKYLWRKKGGVEDLRKAQHYIEIWISAEIDASQ